MMHEVMLIDFFKLRQTIYIMNEDELLEAAKDVLKQVKTT